jgi:hypothetical protein
MATHFFQALEKAPSSELISLELASLTKLAFSDLKLAQICRAENKTLVRYK